MWMRKSVGRKIHKKLGFKPNFENLPCANGMDSSASAVEA
jgi:hypothetical protein